MDWILLLLLVLILLLLWQQRRLSHFDLLEKQLENKHRAILSELHQGISDQTERNLQKLHELQIRQEQFRSELLQQLLQTLSDQGRADQLSIQQAFKHSSEQLHLSIQQLTQNTDHKLEQISGRVNERLDEGFKKTNETFVNVMSRLATIDEAQKKIDGLTSNMVSLQQLLGDKRARGAFGEIQLEALVRNVLPHHSYDFQVKLSNGTRVDCLLKLPAPTGHVAVDAKFPLENYQRMLDDSLPDAEQQNARRQFKLDIKKHIDHISQKYLIANETADGAVMFIPAEAVFAEIHAHHGDLVQYAQQQRVWLVSPTTLMAVLNTARAVLKDGEMRQQVHIIQHELAKLSVDFRRFDERMKKLTDNLRRANEEASQVEISSRKISEHFARIETLEHLEDRR